MSAEGSSKAAQMRLRGQELIRQGTALVREAERVSSTGEDAVDFDTLPGRSAEMRAEALYMGRRIRDRLFPPHTFGEPAWDILLALFLGNAKDGSVPIRSVLEECDIPTETGFRWVAYLTELDLVKSNSDPEEEVARAWLTPAGLRLMNRFFEYTEGKIRSSRGQERRFRSI